MRENIIYYTCVFFLNILLFFLLFEKKLLEKFYINICKK